MAGEKQGQIWSIMSTNSLPWKDSSAPQAFEALEKDCECLTRLRFGLRTFCTFPKITGEYRGEPTMGLANEMLGAQISPRHSSQPGSNGRRWRGPSQHRSTDKIWQRFTGIITGDLNGADSDVIQSHFELTIAHEFTRRFVRPSPVFMRLCDYHEP